MAGKFFYQQIEERWCYRICYVENTKKSSALFEVKTRQIVPMTHNHLVHVFKSTLCPYHFLVAQIVKRLLQCSGPMFCYLDREDTLEKEMATHSSILA